MARDIVAAVLRTADGPYRLEIASLEGPRFDEVLVRIEATGICHTDIAARALIDLPAVFGHEGTGVVEAVGGGVSDIAVGDTVIMAYAFCGTCSSCSGQKRFHCEASFPLNFGGSRGDGSMPISIKGRSVSSAFFQQSAFASYAVVPARCLVKVDACLPKELRAALPCGIATGSAAITNVFRPGPGASLLVFGLGSVGLSAILTARNLGVETIIGVDVHESRLSLATDLGASSVVRAGTDDLLVEVRAKTKRGVDFALDTSGAASVWGEVFPCLAMGGTFGFVTVPQPFDQFSFKPFALVAQGLTLKFIIQGESNSKDVIPRLIDWHQQGCFELERLVATFPFNEINEAHAAMQRGQVIKPVLIMPDAGTPPMPTEAS
jgi:aryl-alcohol dehydrogenase